MDSIKGLVRGSIIGFSIVVATVVLVLGGATCISFCKEHRRIRKEAARSGDVELEDAPTTYC